MAWQMINSIASVVGILTAPYALLQSAKAIWSHICRYLHNDQRNGHLQHLADVLKLTISGPDFQPPSFDHFNGELDSVLGQLQQIKKRSMRLLYASSEHFELEQVERKLEGLKSQIFELYTCNERFDLPSCEVGFNRGEKALDFLRRSDGKADFRVIGIHGLPGLGKTTILKYVYNEVSAKVPRQYALAYVQIGDDATHSTIRDAQASILRQLGGDNKDFPSVDFGKEKLRNHFQKLRTPFFLAIDNVFEVADLEHLLPRIPWSGNNLPTHSCIMITCRKLNIVETLVTNICGLQMSDKDRVCEYEPSCLNDEESRRLFVECAAMQDVSDSNNHQELLNAFVPLCGGLPLALTVLGNVFKDESRRRRKKWQRIQKQWADLDDHEDHPVIKALQLSFDRLKPSCQIAFLDMVSMFYGWSWETVERIVDEGVMTDLKNSSLVWKVDGIDKCNKSALRLGWREFSVDLKIVDVDRVSMHDLMLRFGKSILQAKKLNDYEQYVEPPVEDRQLTKLRYLIMSNKTDNAQEVIQHATGLRMLALQDTWDRSTFLGSSCCNKTSSSKQQQLHFLRVERCNWSRSLLEMKVSQELRELILKWCDDLVQLPKAPLSNLEVLQIHSCDKLEGFSESSVNAPLSNLEVLQISDCPKFEGFSESSVKEWRCLQYLFLEKCCSVTILPEDLGSLPSLKVICIMNCQNLEIFPSLRNPDGPSSLEINGCYNLHTLGDMLCPLESLKLFQLPKLTKLPVGICKASSLQTLSIESCSSLVELLPEEEITYNMTSLSKFEVESCQGLRKLPAGIFQTASKSLIALELRNCTNLVELPHEIGSLRSLETLDLYGCRALEKLPDSIADVTSLKTLRLVYCESLSELPQQIGRLCSLRELSLAVCKKLERLPDSITTMASLKELHLDDCESLKELPKQIEGLLCSLKELKVGGCKKLEKLPDLLSSIGSLEELHLVGYNFQSPTEFPLQMFIERGLCSNLKRLDVCWPPKLEKLPDFLVHITSLEELCLSGCDLTELPQQIGDLCSLKTLFLASCKQLVKLPDSIATITSLEDLYLTGCESLTELPQQIGDLCSLKKLHLNTCKQLVKLPDSIATITSLEELCLTDGESLKELPQDMGGLCSLKKLSLEECDKLEKLPVSIASISSLEKLDLRGCKRLTELPEKMGGWCSLTELVLYGCDKKLEKLPDSISSITSLKILRWY